MKKLEDNLMARTFEVWQPRNERRLSPDDAREMVHNVLAFFTLLLEWETKEQQMQAGKEDDSYYAKSA